MWKNIWHFSNNSYGEECLRPTKKGGGGHKADSKKNGNFFTNLSRFAKKVPKTPNLT